LESGDAGRRRTFNLGESEFATLPAHEIERRALFKSAAESRGDAETLALLAEVDRRLGLLLEARNEFQQALAKSSADSAMLKEPWRHGNF
jgi:hypothetical protein